VTNLSPRVLLLVLLALAPACSEPAEPSEDAGPPVGGCKLPYIGDKNKDLEMDVIAIGPGTLDRITEGSDITLMLPPQGGRVVFAGVRAKNVNPCGVRLGGALRDTASQQVRIDNRIINLQPQEDGTARSNPNDIFNFANIAACPNQWSDRDLYDQPYELTISLTDKDEKHLTKVLHVTPRCNEPGVEAECLCQCQGDYILGMSCSDAGAPNDLDAGASDASEGGPM